MKLSVILLVSACSASVPHNCANPEQTRPWFRTISDCRVGTAAVVRDLRAEGFTRVMPYRCIRKSEDLR